MKKLTIIILLLAVFGFTSSAQIVVYRGVQSGRQIGGGSDFHIAESQTVAFDTTGSNAVSVSTFKLNGTKFVQVESHAFNPSQISGRNGATFTALSEYVQTTNSTGSFFVLAYGQNVPLTIAPGVTGSAPRVLTAKSIEKAGGVVWDSSINLAFDSKDTAQANTIGQTPAQFAAALENKLLSEGYTESIPLD